MTSNISITFHILELLVILLLVGYLFYIKLFRNRYTEKRFNFVALWSCAGLLAALLMYLFDNSIWKELAVLLNREHAVADWKTKTLATIAVMFYVHRVSMWSISWNGLTTTNAHEAKRSGIPVFFLSDGIQETYRIIRRRPPYLLYSGTEDPSPLPALREPIAALPYHVQVKELILGRWAEYIVDDSAWVEDSKCWYGEDSSLMLPLLIVCALNEQEPDPNRLRAQISHHSPEKNLKLILVFERLWDKKVAEAKFSSLAHDVIVYSFNELVEAMLPLARYKQDIEREFCRKKLATSEVTISETIVDTRVQVMAVLQNGQLSNTTDSISFRDYFQCWASRSDSQHIALLGDYGQGKSTAALELTYRILHEQIPCNQVGNRIPLLVRLTGVSPKTSTPEELLGAWGSRFGLNGRALLALHRAGRTVMIFDAFDEMANVADRADRFDHFCALWKFACEGAKIMFTGRPNFFLDNEELKNALGISERVAAGPYCSAVRIQPFAESDIRRSLRWLTKEKVDPLMDAIQSFPRLKEIAERPSLLFQLSQLWDGGHLGVDDENIESASIICRFVSYSLERQLLKQYTDVASTSADRIFIPLRQSELTFFTAGCAVAALSEGRHNALPESVFSATVRELWRGVDNEDRFSRRATEDGALGMPLRVRLADHDDPVEICQQAVRTHGIIEHDPSRQALYKYSHKTFAEALAASVLTAGATGQTSEYSDVWKVMRPVRLLEQGTILEFCQDLAEDYFRNIAGTSEAKVFARITFSSDNVMTRFVYFFLRWNVILNYANFELARRFAKQFATGKKLTGRIISLVLILAGIVSGVIVLGMTGLYSGRLSDGFPFSWLEITFTPEILALVAITTGAYVGVFGGYLYWLATRVKSARRVVLFCHMVANANRPRSGGRNYGYGGTILSRALKLGALDPREFFALRRDVGDPPV